METLVSSWADGKTLPESYVFPPNERPEEDSLSPTKTTPVIDIGTNDRAYIVQQIMEAARDYGSFQVVNHGVARKLMDDSRVAFKEFFELPSDEKLKYCSGDYNKCKLYTSTMLYEKEKTHLWRDALKLNCNPLEECIQYWPDKPTTYRKTVGELVVEMNELGSRILELICEGLGLEPGYFANELSQQKNLAVNHYPSCPNPSMTFGAGKHTDPSLLTILLLDHVLGLQVWKDPEWFGVEFIPDAFEVLIGDQLTVVSNGKVKSGEHRVVTNAKEARTSAAFFISPTYDCIVEPAKALVSAEDPPLFNPEKFEDSFRIKYNMAINK